MWEDVRKFIIQNKFWILIAVAFFCGVFLLSFPSRQQDTAESESSALEEYKAELEDQLTQLCSSVEGVGKCKVMVTFSKGEENTYKGSAIVQTKPAVVLGVTVVCEGGSSKSVSAEITRMMCALFDIGANRVAVLKLSD